METRSVIKMTVLVGLITTLAWPPSGLALAHSESPPGTATSGHGAETSGPDGVIGVALHVAPSVWAIRRSCTSRRSIPMGRRSNQG